jgi:CubicO group peptidase (beta-lactamase class C family)
MDIIITRVSGLSLDKFFSTFIFSPLKMTKSFLFKDYTKIIPNRATGYSYGPYVLIYYTICCSILADSYNQVFYKL